MRILLTNHHLVNVGGTETWIKTMAEELVRLGHDVEVLTLHVGPFAKQINVPVISEFTDDYDLIIANHNTTIQKTDTPIIFTTHSFFIDIEQPDGRANVDVAVTEECASKGQSVIRNGIDTERFKGKPINEELKTILYLSHPWNKKALPIIEEACKDYELITLTEETYNIEELINKADLVIGMGRCLLEAMSCGRNVISGDHRSFMTSFRGAGMITEDNFDELKRCAFSGRENPIEFTVDKLKEEIAKYDPKRNLRHRILDEYNIKKTVQDYLEIYYDLNY